LNYASQNSGQFLNSNELGKKNVSGASIAKDKIFLPSLIDVLRKSGGLKASADLTQIDITRVNPISQGGGRIKATINLIEAIEKKEISNKNLRVLDGDTITVGKSEIPLMGQISSALKASVSPDVIEVFVSGRILSNPGQKVIKYGSSLNDVIYISGGTSTIKGNTVFLRYNSDGSVDKRNIKLKNSHKPGSYNNPYLESGDIIYVGRNVYNIATEVLNDITSPFKSFVSGYVLYKVFDDWKIL